MRRRDNSTANATSPLAMGKALVLTITVGSAAAFSGGSSNSAAIQQQRISTSRRIHHTSPNYNRHFLHNPTHSNNEFHSIGALHYRDGDEDQSSSMRVANRSAVDEATGSNTATTISTETPSSSRGVSKVNLFMPIVGLMPSMPSVPSQHSVEEDKEQLAMDQYLEYIDRRYSRLKPTSHKRPKGGVLMDIPPIRKIFFSTLSLHKLPVLTAAAFGSPHVSTLTSISSEEEKKKAKESRDVRREALRNGHESEDALKSLGLSSLASARLQQRLHVPRDLRDEYMSLTSGTTNAVNFINHIVHLNDVPVILSPKKADKNKAVSMDMEGGRTSSYTSLSFTAQFKLLFSTLRNVTLAFVNTMQILTAFASRMVSEVLDKGGFRRSVRLMSIVPIMLVFMFKPLFSGAMKQGTKV